MKEVTDYYKNMIDTMGSDHMHWFDACKTDPPVCDGLNWHMKALF